MSDAEAKLKRMIGMVPGVDWQDILSLGMRYLDSKLDIEYGYLEQTPNGVSINLRLGSQESIEEVAEFWEEYMGDFNKD